MKILLVSTQDYIHHPIPPSRHHNIFEELAARHEVHVPPHFHVSRGKERGPTSMSTRRPGLRSRARSSTTP